MRLCNFPYYIYILKKSPVKELRQLKGALSKRIKRLYKWAKILISALTLGIAIYGCANNPKDFKGIAITVILFICWALQLILELLTISIEARLLLFQAALTKDFSPVIKIYNKITKTEDSPEDHTKQLNILNKLLPSKEKNSGAKAADANEKKPKRIGFFRKKKASETEAVVVKK